MITATFNSASNSAHSNLDYSSPDILNASASCASNSFDFSTPVQPIHEHPLYPGKEASIYGAMYVSIVSVYKLRYSGVPVYEMVCRNVACMMRKSDSFLNATQILKVAGIDKGRRTKLLVREISLGNYEKVQGGYGKYQGTWIPFERGLELARNHGVDQHLAPLLNFQQTCPDADKDDPIKKQAEESLLPQKRQKRKKHSSTATHATVPRSYDVSVLQHSVSMNGASHSTEEQRKAILSLLKEDSTQFYASLSGMDVNIELDESGNSGVHYAAKKGNVDLLKTLVQRGACLKKLNAEGESALISAIQTTSCYNLQSFPNIMIILDDCLLVVDSRGKSVLHHVCHSSVNKDMRGPSVYYLEYLLERFSFIGETEKIINLQDANGDTAICIAARFGDEKLVSMLLENGADPSLCNKAGLKVWDFGIDCGQDASYSLQAHVDRPINKIVPNFEKIKQILSPTGQNSLTRCESCSISFLTRLAVQYLIDDMNQAFVHEMQEKEAILKYKHEELRVCTSELFAVRRQNAYLRKQAHKLPILVQRIKHLETHLLEEWTRRQSEQELMAKYYAKQSGFASDTDESVCAEEVEMLRIEIREKNATLNALRRQIMDAQFNSSTHDTQCRKIISVCCGVEMDKVDGMLDALLQVCIPFFETKKKACESDGSKVDVPRIATFMSKVKQQETERV